MGPTMPGVGVFEAICKVRGGFSIFSCFWVNLSIFGRVSRAVVLVDSAFEYVEVTDGVSEEIMVVFGEFSLVGPIFAFLLFPGSTGSCNVNRGVGEPISACSDVLVSSLVPVVAVEAGRMVGVRAAGG